MNGPSLYQPESLKRCSITPTNLECFKFDRDLKIGQVVRVISGPFAKAIGQLDRLDANNRVKVLLNIMGGVSATLDRAALQAA